MQLSRLSIVLLLTVSTGTALTAQPEATRLIVRIDDMGFSHAANQACIAAYRDGIARSVEVMVPGPWFEEAVELLREHPGLDVGVHLVLTSEWSRLKWRPLTHAPSLVDADGYFYPMIWPNDRFPEGSSLQEADWKLDEIEQELRAQIELAMKRITQVTHLTAHMGCMSMTDETRQLMRRLAEEYQLDIFTDDLGVQRTPSWSGHQRNAAEKKAAFLEMLDQLTPGTWLTIEHPGYDVPELETVGHTGYTDVAVDRQGVTDVFTDPEVLAAIRHHGIELIGYQDLK